ncbi:MAG: DUF4276 family protein [Candidatus Cloacimonadota bacterium]
MIRLHVLGEGQTEKRFVESLLVSYLIHFNVIADVCCFLTRNDESSGQQYKGGISNYAKVKSDIVTRIHTDNHDECRFTTMIDLYGLPDDFPGYHEASSCTDPYRKVEILESAFAQDIADPRFIPYIQLHEFEALIFADPGKLKEEYIDNVRQINSLIQDTQHIAPEMINDNPSTSPSHRIYGAIPAYDKYYAGSAVTESIGLDRIRQKCPHFNEWLTKLEGLNN